MRYGGWAGAQDGVAGLDELGMQAIGASLRVSFCGVSGWHVCMCDVCVSDQV